MDTLSSEDATAVVGIVVVGERVVVDLVDTIVTSVVVEDSGTCRFVVNIFVTMTAVVGSLGYEPP